MVKSVAPPRSPTAATTTAADSATAATITVGCRASHASTRSWGRDMLSRSGSNLKATVDKCDCRCRNTKGDGDTTPSRERARAVARRRRTARAAVVVHTRGPTPAANVASYGRVELEPGQRTEIELDPVSTTVKTKNLSESTDADGDTVLEREFGTAEITATPVVKLVNHGELDLERQV